MRSRHISQVIAATAEQVYAIASNPDNLPRWASGLAESTVTRRGDVLVMDSPMGEVTVRFVPHNDHGILDHDVTLPTGDVVNNPVRVISHPDGAEVVFTVRQFDLTDDQFDTDCQAVARDLRQLAAIVVTK